MSRNTAIESVLKTYSAELDDSDDAPQIWIGLAIALGKKRELQEDILQRARRSINSIREQIEKEYPDCQLDFNSLETAICNRELLGEEAHYPRKKIYKPDWKVGDTFAFHMKGEFAKKFGLDGKIALLRKVCEKEQTDGTWNQIMYLSICASDEIPRTQDEVKKCGLIPWGIYEDGYAFYYELPIKSKKDEKRYPFEKIGNFEMLDGPKEKCSESAQLLFGQINENTNDIISHVCWRFREYGIHEIS